MLSRPFSSLASPGQVYDVAIVGAGMVGAAVAALLRSNPLTAGMRLAVIDQQPPPLTLDMPQYPDLRVSTITPANMQLLQQAGAWAELQQAAPAFQDMQVWEHAGPGFLSWDAADIGLPHMGCVVENRLLQAALLRAAERGLQGSSSSSSSPSESTTTATSSSNSSEAGCLDFLCPGTVKSLKLPGLSDPAGSITSSNPSSNLSSNPSSPSSSLAELHMADGSLLHCRLVVAADGARSKVRTMAGFRTTGWSYNQRGLVASVATDEPNTTAWQRFLPTGPLALLPVRSGFSNVVWTTTPDMARQLEGYSSSQFADAVNAVLQPDPATFSAASAATSPGLQAAGSSAGPLSAATSALQALGGALGQLLGPAGSLLQGGAAAAVDGGSYWRPPPLVLGWVGSAPKSFPLQLQHSGRYAAQRLALVGDAAHAIHPMAGQGVNLGLGDAGALAAALASAREVGQDVGDLALLQRQYEGPRQRANLAMMAALEALWRGFGVQAGLAGAARAAGMGVLNSVPPLKNSIMKYAMGLA